MRPPTQLNVQHAGAARPHALGADAGATAPLVLVKVEAVDTRDVEERGKSRLLGGLAGKKVGGGAGEDKADGEGGGRVGGEECGEDEGELDGGYGA